MNKQQIKRIEEALDERWCIMCDSILQEDTLSPYHVEKAHYEGMIKVVEFSGCDWVRDEKGKHKIFK